MHMTVFASIFLVYFIVCPATTQNLFKCITIPDATKMKFYSLLKILYLILSSISISLEIQKTTTSFAHILSTSTLNFLDNNQISCLFSVEFERRNFPEFFVEEGFYTGCLIVQSKSALRGRKINNFVELWCLVASGGYQF